MRILERLRNAVTPARGTGAVRAALHYLRDGCHPVTYMNDEARSVVVTVSKRVQVLDARELDPEPALDGEGFACVRHRSAVTDFGDVEELRRIYLPEIRELLAKVIGADDVYMHPNPIVRSQNHLRSYGEGMLAGPVARIVHTDLTDVSTLAESARALRYGGISDFPARRLRAYNVWRSLTPPPQDVTLALCDMRTVRPEQQVPMPVYGHPNNQSGEGEITTLVHDPANRWFYYSGLTTDEVLIFQQRDTAMSGVSGVPHAAFDHPISRKAAVPRMSIEVRAFAYSD